MVQRKVPNKLAIQADHVKSEKLLPSTLQHQDMKNKGADLKKKMKKSGSFKRPKQVEQPGKPPPLVLSTPAATPKKQSPIRTMIDTTPNYMKSTTSSDARKERGQVSSQSPDTSPDSKRSSRRNSMNSKNNSASGNKPARTLARTSSLKLVRTLTKTPSFKPPRTSAKKRSPVILCENLNVQRETCSSTMKGRKFPGYLTLSPGATEGEGTSIMKVCPYTYCSLNGHHHEPLPPLKSFLSARRRMLKAQRSIKIGCLSPRRAKPARDIMKEIEAAGVKFDEKLPFEDSWNSSSSSHLLQEESTGFFFEIYSKERDDTFQNNQDTTAFSVIDVKPSIGVNDETKSANEQAAKSPSNEQLGLEIDSHENLHQSRDVTFADMDADDYFPEQNKNGEIAEVYPPNLAQGKTKPDFLNLMYESEAESTPSIQSEEAEFATSDMDWEAGLYSASCPYDGASNPIQIDHVIDLEKANSALDKALLDEVVFKSGEIVGDNSVENLPDEIAQESIDDKTVFEAWFGDNWLAPEEVTDMEEDDDKDRSDNLVDAVAANNSALMEKAAKKPSLIGEDKEGSEPEDVTSSMGTEAGNGIESITKTQNADVAAQQMMYQNFEDCQDMGSQEFENPHGISGNINENLKNSIGTQTDSEFEDPRDMSGNLDEVLKRSIGTQTDIEDDQSDALIEMCCFTDKVLDGNMIAEEGKENIDACIPFTGIENFTVLQDSDEAMEHTGTAVHDESQLGAITNEGEPKQTLVNDALPDQVKDCSSATQSISSSDDLDSSENENDEATETAESISLEDQTHSRMTVPSFTGNTDQNIHKTQVDNAKDASGTRIKAELVGSNLNEDLAICRIIKGTNRAIVENKEPTEFNPRAPNFLPVEADPEAEKVDLKHLMLDEKKNADDWMLDHALQQAVTKLAPARKRKVALLVEAFETVLPIPKYETHLRHTTTAFSHVRPMQACS